MVIKLAIDKGILNISFESYHHNEVVSVEQLQFILKNPGSPSDRENRDYCFIY